MNVQTASKQARGESLWSDPVPVEAVVNRNLYDPYRVGRIYKFDQLIIDHQKELLRWFDAKRLKECKARYVRQNVPIEKMYAYHHGPWIAYNKAKPQDRERIDKIIAAIKKGGTMRPLLLDEDYDLLEGQHRMQAMVKMKWKVIPVVRILGTACKIGI